MLEIRTISVEDSLINEVHQTNQVQLDEQGAVNSYAVLRSVINPKHTALVQHLGAGKWKKIRSNKDLIMQGLSPRDAAQAAFFNTLQEKNITVAVAVGEAGTGKTTIALAYALDEFTYKRKPILLSKPTSMVGEGNAFGPVPGDMAEKYAPYLASYEITIKRLLGRDSRRQVQDMIKNGHLQYIPIELVRGSEFADCTFIVDEVQNLSWHELKTIVSRMGEDTTLILLGDLAQIDTGARFEDTGIYQFLRSAPFKDSPICSAIRLKTQYRSAITRLVSEADKWIKSGGKQSNSARDTGEDKEPEAN